METLLRHTSQIYAFTYFGAIIVLALLECVVPRRAAGDTLRLRWAGNFGITIIGAIVVRALFPVVGIGWAIFCSERGWGLFNQLASPWWLAFVVTVLVMDLAYYTQHYLLHHIAVLWRLHRTHHTDQDYDFTTGVRFHPFETVFTTAVLMGIVLVLGAPPFAVFVSQLLTVAVSFAEHANVHIPTSLDRLLRLVVVTPDMHRIHHSQDIREGQSNFATTFPWWDRLFGTYLDQPAAGHDAMRFGVAEFVARKHLTLPWMVAQPFLRPDGPSAAGPALADLTDKAPQGR